MQVLRNTRVLMLNGFVLDELPGPLVVAAARQTRAAGGSVFFDPGADCAACSGAHASVAAVTRKDHPSALAANCHVSTSTPAMLQHCKHAPLSFTWKLTGISSC